MQLLRYNILFGFLEAEAKTETFRIAENAAVFQTDCPSSTLGERHSYMVIQSRVWRPFVKIVSSSFWLLDIWQNQFIDTINVSLLF
jgi:hypothetical protein